ncbi:hypothetical protein DWY80_27240, partial [Bacteroides ovatus]
GAGAANVNTRGTELVPGSSSVYFPAGGYRNGSNGNTNYAGNNGYSWSGSSYSTTGACNLSVNSGGAYWNANSRYDGVSVRCIRE